MISLRTDAELPPELPNEIIDSDSHGGSQFLQADILVNAGVQTGAQLVPFVEQLPVFRLGRDDAGNKGK